LSSIVNIGVLGAKYTAITTIPFVETIKLINIENIITNIDSIAIIIIFFGGFFKMSVYLNATILALKSLFKTEKYKLILFIFSAILFWFSIVFEKNYMYHKWMFPFDSLYFQIIYSNVFPLLLLIVYLIKKKRAEL
jgi:spore germination protein KB